MAWFPLIIASLFVVYVGFLVPFLSRRRYRAFLREVVVDPAARTRYYRRNVAYKWLWLVAIGIIVLLGFVPFSALGLNAPLFWGPTWLLLAEFVILIPIVLLVQRRALAKRRGMRQLQLLIPIKDLFPRTPRERLLWLLVSITAGICEEIVFRGFLPLYFLHLGALFNVQTSYLLAVIVSSALFGLVHLYQGWKSVLATALLDAILAYIYTYTGSLIFPIIGHILIDARLVFLAPAILKLDSKGEDAPVDVDTQAGKNLI